MIWQKQYINHRNEWHSGDYIVVEMIYSDSSEYFCYRKKNLLTTRLTPELAREFCENDAGKL